VFDTNSADLASWEDPPTRSSNALKAWINRAEFPLLKDFNTYDFSVIPKLNKQKMLEPACGECPWYINGDEVAGGLGYTRNPKLLRIRDRGRGLVYHLCRAPGR